MTEAATQRDALAGLRVVTVGDSVAPAFAGRWLAAFGAEVTAVDAPGGHWSRRYSPTGTPIAEGTGPLRAFLYAGASITTLDPLRERDRAALQELLVDADLLLHDLTPVRLASWGLDAGSLRSQFPALVQVALLPFGSDGPYAGYAATSIVLLALGGYQFLTGEPGREPLMLPGFQPEYLTAFYGVVGGLASILSRRRAGTGCDVEISMVEALASLHQFTVSQYLSGGGIRTRHGNRWENLYPITMLPCRDGYLALGISAPDQWERLCLMLGRPDLAEDSRFLTAIDRHRNADALDDILLDWLKDRDVDAVFEEAQRQWRLPVNRHYELGGVLTDPQYRERGFWVRPEGDKSGILHPGLPVRMSATPWRVRKEPLVSPPAGIPRERNERLDYGGSLGTDDRGAPMIAHTEEWSTAVSPDHRLPLAGLRVVDFTRVWSGPLCTRILADLGADVIKIDPPFQRNVGAPAPAAGASGDAVLPRPVLALGKHARNKRSMSVDLRMPAGQDLIKRLVARSDILVENFTARVMPNFGLAYEVLAAINPRLVMLSMPGYGMTGPYREYLGYGSATEAMTGLTALLGYPDQQPRVSAIAYPDAVAGMAGAASVLTALVYREGTGAGQLLDFSQLEPVSLMLGEYFLSDQMSGQPAPRMGNRHPTWAPHGAYRCRGDDEWVSIAVRSDVEWAAFCRVAGLTKMPGLATEAARRAQRGLVDALVSGWTSTLDKFDAMDRLQRAGIAAGAVLNAREMVENRHLAHRGFFVEAAVTDGSTTLIPGTPMRFDGRTRDVWRAAPLPGEHNHEILHDILGMSDGEIAALESDGVLAGSSKAVD